MILLNHHKFTTGRSNWVTMVLTFSFFDDDDRLLFEMLTLSGVQVGADWASILRRRHIYRFGTQQHCFTLLPMLR
jgi:hypothetical protein